MASQTNQQHFILIPLMSQSHIIPFTEMAKLFASNGVTVTMVLTPLNASRFNMVLDQAKASNLKIQLQLLPFPCVEAGLPKGCENMDTLPSPKYQPLFFAACYMLKEPLEKWISELEKLPSCIVSDICLPWTSNVASKFNIPRVGFHVTSCFTLLCTHNISLSKVHERFDSMSTPFVVPDLPDTIEFTKAQLPEIMKQDSKTWKETIDQFKESERSAQGILMNTFEELEMDYVRGYQKVANKVWCIGPLSLHDKLTSDKFGKDNKSFVVDDSEPKSECLKFLNSNKAFSVIYVCFGSLSFIPTAQLKELALGLEASNHPFIWVIKRNDCSIELEKWLKEENFEERNKGKGLIIKGWASQVEILSHPSTGGFLTHCGWNSTMETISCGVPMITWPMFAEQFFNEKHIVQVLKIGVRIGVVEPMETFQGEKVLVKKEDVKKAIEKLMENGEEGKQRRKRAKEIKDLAYKAVEVGGSSHFNCKLFIQHIVEQQAHKS